MASYATPADMLVRYQAGRLGQLVRDDGSIATPSQLLTDANLQAALDDAAGEIESACFTGQRYSAADLASLVTAYRAGTAQAGYNSGAFLIRLNCDLAYGALIGRKGMDAATTQAMSPRVAWAASVLQQLGNGDKVFTLAAQMGAGVPVNVKIDKNWTLLSGYLDRYFGDLGGPDRNNLTRS